MRTLSSVWYWGIQTRSPGARGSSLCACGAGRKCVSAAFSFLSLCGQVRHSRASSAVAALLPQAQLCAVCDILAVLLDCSHSSMVWICMPRSAFFRRALIVQTALSASQLLWGYLGLLAVWMKPYAFANLEKSQEASCGLLSDMTCLGIPRRAKMIFSCWMTLAEVSCGRRTILM